MLVAYGPEEQLIFSNELQLEQIKYWSKRNLLSCPNCRGVVHVRGGLETRIQLHFAHQRGECPWRTESETIRHMRGKMVLAEWLVKQFPDASVSLEKRLPEPNRIADIFVAHAGGQRCAVEFQCAPLDVAEWQMRHTAYRKANIQDIWIIGSNRRWKQEAFIEAILASAGEIMFLDPLPGLPQVWLRWAVNRETVFDWQAEIGWTPTLEGWVGRTRSKLGATLSGLLQDVSLEVDGQLIHPQRATFEARMNLLQTMKVSHSIDKAALNAYLKPFVGEEVLNVVLFPMLRAYLRDPDLLRRYNYGRGYGNQFFTSGDINRVQQARIWLDKLSLQGFPPDKLEKLARGIPLVGPYVSFANFVEMLVYLSNIGETNKQS